MRNFNNIIAFILLAAAVASCDKNSLDDKRRNSFSCDITPTEEEKAAYSLRKEQTRLALEHYMKRHNVMDEGYEMVARYASEGNEVIDDYLPKQSLKPCSGARWRAMPRRGTSIERDQQGRIVIFEWLSDSLASGIRLDSEGTYAGEFDPHLQASGHGTYRAADGSEYYEGHWSYDCRQDFGFSVTAEQLRAGHWRGGTFWGERMHYTSERIYGIDISRYQHEQGRRTYAINWTSLRIKSLGRKPGTNITGEVDYPVRFVFIKSTEGTDIKNKYFASDYKAARAKGISVGAYHFFSTKKDAKDQAAHFLSSTTYQKGDLPPVLDVEPSDEQIRRMGGSQALFRSIRTWMEAVEKAWGVRPILYINQMFVRKYLPDAPDVKAKYPVWIARYGEYKPDIQLAFWQLSPEGRVEGIRGDVDINVFGEGYESQWQEYLDELRKS